MLSPEQYRALDMLEQGGYLNTVSSTARALVAAGLAVVDFSYLRITEIGRRELRRQLRADDGNVSDLADHGIVDPARFPMGKPPETMIASKDFVVALEEVVVAERIQHDESVVSDQTQRALRAAGVASGVTDVWVDEKWVKAFVEAWLND
jgi:hypothetical protein